MRYTLKDLQSLPTLSTGQADDLKKDDGLTRVWLSRCGVDDGEPAENMVTVEYYRGDGRWEQVRRHPCEPGVAYVDIGERPESSGGYFTPTRY